ncbi:MAG: AmmeMemoRadiSam system protein B, partial [Proteobacteria bacterium]|nr:AmmeMemoRadiSam system protein B [Pseudomonadota bacterium]
YPGTARALQAEVDRLLAQAAPDVPRSGFPKALVVPHAGYVYSGAVAAQAYATLTPARGVVSCVVLLGPVHRVPVRGLALPGVEAFETPLGKVPVDAAAIRDLAELPQVVVSATAHAQEHSLEVQLPFLQRVLGSFSVVPLAVGTAGVAEVADVLERLWGGRETLIVVSTDLSHYHAYALAQRIDADTLARIVDRRSDIDHDHACGATPLNGLLALARRKRLSVQQLAACNSGDTAGDRDRVVGYSAFSLCEEASIESDAAGHTLIALARSAIACHLKVRDAVAAPQAAWLAQPGASFITLKKHGALRGCIGSLEAHRALGKDVTANAIAAATADPRFGPVTLDEWPAIEVEVSLLSTPKLLHFADDAELYAALQPGEDGVILEFEGRCATFLPQVWEVLPDKRRFLQELAAKAGLPAGTRLAQCTVRRYRVSKWAESDGAALR